MPGVLPSGLLYILEGMLPRSVFAILTPIEAGPGPTMPMLLTLSTASCQISLQSEILSSRGTPKAFRQLDMMVFRYKGGSIPFSPFVWNHTPNSVPPELPAENILPEAKTLGQVISNGAGSLADFEIDRFEV